MKHYKDPIANEIYAYAADGSQDAYIKAGLVPISDAELAALRAPTVEQQKANIQNQIESLERQQLMPRISREALLNFALQQGIATGLTEPQIYATDASYRKLKDLDVSIITLRDQLVAVK